MFRNFDEHGNQLARPNTILIDCERLESGEALDKNFREMASNELERFRREIIEQRQYGRWAFAEFTEVYQIESDFKARVEAEFHPEI